ncbi:MAG TPA: dihydrofolate reductase [Solirubrobacteraceae bacterium]|nr:dihydrofolate reductase [Solirubrobacteraceae bacterium]
MAYARGGTIGREGALPWRLPSDMRHFRELTTGGTVVMGRRTYESLPERFRPLPRRRNLVLSTKPGYAPAGAEPCADLESALAACGEDCFVIGGERVYAAALPRVERVYATEIEEPVEGDAFFPALDPGRWRRAERSPALREEGHSFSFCVYERAA